MIHYNWPVLHLKSVDSTNNYANSLLSNNEIDKEIVIHTYAQTQGRGQSGNSWVSEAGKNLTFSIILFTGYLPAERQFFLSQSISIAIMDYLKNNGITSLVKWPNDIIADNKKISGILIENTLLGNSLTHSIVGIGLNVNQESFEFESANATSMKKITLKEYDLEKELESLLSFIYAQLKELKNALYAKIKSEYLENLFKFNINSQFIANNAKFTGKIIDIEPTGELVILADNGSIRKFMFKEVQFL